MLDAIALLGRIMVQSLSMKARIKMGLTGALVLISIFALPYLAYLLGA